jgi:hypothetical protein
MPAWEALEAVVNEMTIRITTYCDRGEAERRIDRLRVWMAAVDEI